LPGKAIDHWSIGGACEPEVWLPFY